MKLERFKQILEAYGSASHRWPDAERDSAEHLIASSEEASMLMREYRDLDDVLNAFQKPYISQLEHKILERLHSRSGWLDVIVEWILPDTEDASRHVWQPLTAASLVFVLGLFIGLSLEADSDNTTFLWEEDAYWVALYENEP